MRKISHTILFVFFSNIAISQSLDIKSMVDSLSKVPLLYSDTLDCNANLYWRIVARGQEAIPYLISKLTDSLPTNIKFHCKPGRLNVGEVCYFAINEIGYFPMAYVTNMQFDTYYNDSNGGNCWSFYQFFFNNRNKIFYQQKIQKWYQEKRSKYKPQPIPLKELTECQKEYKIGTYLQYKG